MTAITTFQRVEKKYFITRNQKNQLLDKIQSFLTPDEYGESTVCSLYIDTPDYLLIRNSIDAKEESKAYKEKIRLRSYGKPDKQSRVFFEIKKKYKGVVYKRRVEMTLGDAEQYIESGKIPVESQIMSEIDYAMHLYRQPKPAILIAYERVAYYAKEIPSLRITFDYNIRYRLSNLLLENGSVGKKIINDDEVLMEIKTEGPIPLWLADALDECKIYPSSFSKYATAYNECILKNIAN